MCCPCPYCISSSKEATTPRRKSFVGSNPTPSAFQNGFFHGREGPCRAAGHSAPAPPPGMATCRRLVARARRLARFTGFRRGTPRGSRAGGRPPGVHRPSRVHALASSCPRPTTAKTAVFPGVPWLSTLSTVPEGKKTATTPAEGRGGMTGRRNLPGGDTRLSTRNPYLHNLHRPPSRQAPLLG